MSAMPGVISNTNVVNVNARIWLTVLLPPEMSWGISQKQTPNITHGACPIAIGKAQVALAVESIKHPLSLVAAQLIARGKESISVGVNPEVGGLALKTHEIG